MTSILEHRQLHKLTRGHMESQSKSFVTLCSYTVAQSTILSHCRIFLPSFPSAENKTGRRACGLNQDANCTSAPKQHQKFKYSTHHTYKTPPYIYIFSFQFISMKVQKVLLFCTCQTKEKAN